MMRRALSVGSRRGTAYLEYFIAATAVAAATMFAAGNLGAPGGIQDQIQGQLDGQLQAIAGPVN